MVVLHLIEQNRQTDTAARYSHEHQENNSESKESMPSLITVKDSLNGDPTKALAVCQEVYDDIADRMDEHVKIEYCTVFDDFGPEQCFTIVPVSTTLIVISDHIYNMTHKLTFEEFFTENFDLTEWLHKEILLHEDEIPLTAT